METDDYQHLLSSLLTGKISRRDFLKRAIALGIPLAAAARWLGAYDAYAGSLKGAGAPYDGPAADESQALTTRHWYKADLHSHCAVSAEAHPDLGILSSRAQAFGYNAIFLTDHNQASSFEINDMDANHAFFDENYARWTSGTMGSLTSTTNELVTSPVYSGSHSLHLASASHDYGETFVWTRRGPSFRSGNILMNVAIYPVRMDPGSGIYVSVSIGGDPTLQLPHGNVGYTTRHGVISPGKTTVLVWQLGSARQPSGDPNARVITYSLGSYVPNAWNLYTINITQALQDVPDADRPLDYNGLSHLKLAVAGAAGSAEAYFDAFRVDASAPQTPADEFVYRNTLVHTYDNASFKIFPALEMGLFKHAQRFNFAISNPADFVNYRNGIDGIAPTQATGYPSQLNHPGAAGGVSTWEAISTQGEGADQIEVNDDSMVSIWDQILLQGVQILGVLSTDTHYAVYDYGDSVFIYATSLDLDPLMQAMYEGRMFGAHGFSGPLIFNLHSGSSEPYPARYPVYLPYTFSTAHLHLNIPSGLNSHDSIRWIRNGALVATDSPTAGAFDMLRTIPLNGRVTYMRAEVRSVSNVLRSVSQPIFFIKVPDLPLDKSFNVDSIVTPDGRSYTRQMVKGITAADWSVVDDTLTQTLSNPTGSLVRELMTTGIAPQAVSVDGAGIAPSGSITQFNAAAYSTWFYSSANRLLYLKVRHTADEAQLAVEF